MFRKPLWERGVIGVIAAIVAVDLTVGFVTATVEEGSPLAVVILLMLVWFGSYLGRAFRIAVELHEDRLVVRNWVRTYQIWRDEITGFRVGPARFDPVGQAIHVIRCAGHPIEMTVTKRFGLSRRGRDQLDERLHQLQAWHARHQRVHPSPG